MPTAGGLFGLSAASQFERVIGIEISRDGFEGARTNALLNKIDNAEFFLAMPVPFSASLTGKGALRTGHRSTAQGV